MTAASGDGREVRLSVPSMDCASCAATVEDRLADVAGVVAVDPFPGAGTVTVRFDPAVTDRGALVAAVEAAGYPVGDAAGGRAASPFDVWRSPRAIGVGAGALLLAAGVVLEYLLGANPAVGGWLGRELTVAGVGYLGAVALAGAPILRVGIASLRAGRLDVVTLMSGGMVAAVLVGLPFEAATLAVLYSTAELLEQFSVDRTRASLRELRDLAPDVATVMDEGEERTVPAEAVHVGDVVVLRPGDRVPVDGRVTGGESAVDESPVTGESLPTEKGTGDEVYAGSVLQDGYLEVEAAAPASESTIARVVALVEDAERSKTDRERFVDRFTRYYVPAVVAGAVATVPITMAAFGLSFEASFVRGLTLLVVACPCAFVISTPVSVVSGVTAAARHGLLIKGGDKLEEAGRVDLVAFDKTGTVTTGELSVTDVVAAGPADESTVLALAAALERRSGHPIARAIVAAAADRGREVERHEVTDFEEVPGRGVRGTVDGEPCVAGSPSLLGAIPAARGRSSASTGADDGGGTLGSLRETVDRLEGEGKSVVVVGRGEAVVGVVAVADTLRPEAVRAVAALQDLGVETALLTGDNDRTAEAIAGRLGIDDVRAGLLPEEKVQAVRELGQGRTVAMVGDGVNDAPALAAADVGIAMGAAGTDAAIETADVALLGDDLEKLPYLLRLARRTDRVIRQNVWSSIAVKAALAVGAPLGLVSVLLAIVVGDMGMSLAVTGNAMRLSGVKS